MQELVTPDTLDEMDRRVYDLAIQPIPLAELAVRLGMPVGQAQERLERVFRRLGVSDRDGLRALADSPSLYAFEASEPAGDDVLEPEDTSAPDWQRRDEPPPEAIPVDDYVIGEAPALAAPSPAPRLSRRTFLAGGAAAVVAVGGLAAWTYQRGGSGTATPKANAGDDATPAFSDSGDPFPLTVEPGIDETYRHRTWVQGETIDWQHGLFFMLPSAPQVSGYQFLSEGTAGDDWRDYRTLGDGRFVTAVNKRTGRSMLIDRSLSADAWSWGPDYELCAVHGPATLDPTVALFTSTIPEGQRLHFVTLDPLGAKEHGRVDIPAVARFAEPVFLQEPRGSRIAVLDGAGQTPSVIVFDLRTAVEEGRVQLRDEADAKAAAVSARSLHHYNDGVIARCQTATNGRGELPVEYYSNLITWDGRPGAPRRRDDFGTVYSPDGMFVLKDAGQGTSTPDGVPQGWPSVVAGFGAENGTFRVRSATILYGDAQLSPRRWLAGSDGFVVAVRAGGFGEHGYAIVHGPDEPITMIPPATTAANAWAEGMAPSPHHPAFLSAGRTMLYNRTTNRWFRAQLAEGSYAAALDPWSAGDQGMVFALPGLALAIRPAPPLLAPKLETPPYNDLFQFVVDVDPEGLNVRAEPDSSAESRAVALSGDILDLAGDPGATTVVRDGALTWLRVRMRSGVEGWVNSYWLAWA